MSDLLKMARCDTALHAEMEKEQVSHPMEEYREGSPHLERLYEQMDQAQRYHQPLEFKVNL
jgi:hypothetical protein